MDSPIRIDVDGLALDALLFDTAAGRAVLAAVPVEQTASLWGSEIYFPIDAEVALEDGREVVDEGDLGYWPTGSAFCIFYGPTPMSRGDEIRPASPVEVIGRIVGDATVLRAVRGQPRVRVTRRDG